MTTNRRALGGGRVRCTRLEGSADAKECGEAVRIEDLVLPAVWRGRERRTQVGGHSCAGGEMKRLRRGGGSKSEFITGCQRISFETVKGETVGKSTAN